MPSPIFGYCMGLLSLAYLLLCVYILSKLLGGDITLAEASRVWVPLAACYALVHVAWGQYPSLAVLPGAAGLGYGIWLLLRQRAAIKESLDEVLDRDVEKWKQAVAADDRNAYGHLQLGHALVERRDYDAATMHYRKALLLEPKNARDLDSFLSGRTPAEERRLRSRLPDLERLARQLRDRGTAPGPWGR